MKPLLTTTAAICLLLPAAALSQSQGEAEAEQPTETPVATGPIRPGDEDGALPVSDGMAECGAILAVGSTVSTNIVDRRNMENGSAGWFAASGDLAIAEGTQTEETAWETKVTDWAGKIGGMSALAQNGDWMSYCAELGASQGLETRYFQQYAPEKTAEVSEKQ